MNKILMSLAISIIAGLKRTNKQHIKSFVLLAQMSIVLIVLSGCIQQHPEYGDYPIHVPLQIHIVSGPAYFPQELLYYSSGRNVLGCAVPARNAIYVRGNQTRYGLAVNPETLGHELLELLAAGNSSICNPHHTRCMQEVPQ